MNVIGQNLANANTPGYRRQVTDLAESTPVPVGDVQIGTGVTVTGVEQLKSSLIDTAVNANSSDTSNTTAQLTTLTQIQSVFGQVGNSIQTNLDNFFSQVQQLAARPQRPRPEPGGCGQASTLANNLNTAAQPPLHHLRRAHHADQLGLDGRQLQRKQIAVLNGKIAGVTAGQSRTN